MYTPFYQNITTQINCATKAILGLSYVRMNFIQSVMTSLLPTNTHRANSYIVPPGYWPSARLTRSQHHRWQGHLVVAKNLGKSENPQEERKSPKFIGTAGEIRWKMYWAWFTGLGIEEQIIF